MKKKQIFCEDCAIVLDKTQIALNKKLISRQIENFLCISCLSQSLGCTEEDLEIKIEEYKEQGCSLFV